jgi:hypothetical protein
MAFTSRGHRFFAPQAQPNVRPQHVDITHLTTLILIILPLEAWTLGRNFSGWAWIVLSCRPHS